MALFESEKVRNIQALLNSKKIAPSRGYRRNVSVYSLVCYVNNITGCYLSRNEEPIPIFIGRARQHMVDFPAGNEWEGYYELVSSYLDLLESHLKRHGIDTNYH